MAIQELIDVETGTIFVRSPEEEWAKLANESKFGEKLFEGYLAEGAKFVCDLTHNSAVVVCYGDFSPAGICYHFINETSELGSHFLIGACSASETSGIILCGVSCYSDDGINWTIRDLEQLSLWGSNSQILGQWANEALPKYFALFGIVQSKVHEKIIVKD